MIHQQSNTRIQQLIELTNPNPCCCAKPAGATGLVGSRLAAKLASQGNKVRVVTRNVNSAKSKLQYPGLEFYSLSQIADAVKGSDAVVNLAGEPIGTRWVGRDCAKQLVHITASCSLCRSSCKRKSTPTAPLPLLHMSAPHLGLLCGALQHSWHMSCTMDPVGDGRGALQFAGHPAASVLHLLMWVCGRSLCQVDT